MSRDAVEGASLRSGFLASAARDPHHEALVIGAESLTYADLSCAARRISAALLGATGTPPERVGILAHRSVAAYAGTLGALCAGAAFVPLNPRFPTARTQAMARRGHLDAIVVDRLGASQLGELLDGMDPVLPLVTMDDESTAAVRALGMTALDSREFDPLCDLPPVLGDDIAYLLFTSGSTGEPKGVAVSHANVLHYLGVMRARLRLTSTDRCSQTFDQTFDVSVHDLFVAWDAGATLVAMQSIELLAPVRFVERHRITVWVSVPSVVALAMRKGMLRAGSMPTLRYSMFFGEPLPHATAMAWHEAAPDSTIDNGYGPTELTIGCLVHRWDAAQRESEMVNGIVPIGRPFAGLGVIVVDDAMRIVVDGEPGELLVCGPQTAPGYWRAEELTTERFVHVNLSDTRAARFYRTGDRVRRLPSGDYAFLGRVDDQVKVMGYRVELGEIEAVLRRAGAIQAAAMGWPVEDGRALGIVAFVAGDDAPPDELTAAARRVLPPYMVPSRIEVLEEMPLNANGKIDRRQLLAFLAPVAVA